MPYGILKADTLTYYTATGDVSVAISGIISSSSPLISGVSGVFTTSVSGATVTGNAGQFTTITGGTAQLTTITGGTAQFTNITGVSGTFTSRISGATVTGISGQFTTITATTGVFTTSISGATVSGDAGLFNTISGNQGVFNSSLSVPSGTASSPSISFNGDPNTGIYSPGADQVAISTGGSGRLFVDANGRLLINNSSAVASATAVEGALQAQGIDALANANFGRWSNDNAGYAFYFGKSRGVSIGSQVAVSSGDFLGALFFEGSDGTQLRRGASITANVDGAVTSNNVPGRLIFQTALGGTTTERMRITSAGLVGVGTSTPVNSLDVDGGVGINYAAGLRAVRDQFTTNNIILRHQYVDPNDQLEIAPIGSSSTSAIAFRTATGSALGTRMFISSAGNVGVGTTTPGYPLDVQGESGGATLRLRGGSGGSSIVQFTDNAVSTQWGTIAATSGSIDISHGSVVRFLTNSSERARIDSSGRLLVGTSTAAQYNHYTNEIRYQQAGLNGAGASAQFAAFENGLGRPALILSKSRGASVGTNTVVQSGDTLGEFIFIGADGTNYTRGAEISCQVDGTPGANDMPGRLVFSTTADGASAPTERMRITSGGDVRIGTAAALDVGTGTDDGFRFFAPNTAAGIFQCSNNDVVGYFRRRSSDGTMLSFRRDTTQVGTIAVTTTATAYNTSSDYRLKENVTPVTDGITRLQQLKPSRFNFIVDLDKVVDGFIAHEVQAVVPEAITGTKDEVDADGNPIYQGIDQSKLVPLLTAALQEAIDEIESLKTRVAALESA